MAKSARHHPTAMSENGNMSRFSQVWLWHPKERAAIIVFIVTASMVGGGMFAFVYHQDQSRPEVETSPPMAGRTPFPDELPHSSVAILAGTGTAIPVLELLVEEFGVRNGVSLRIAPSIGSSGGLAALRDGKIDCAVISRKLTSDEARGLQVRPFAMASVVLAGGK